MAADQLHDFYSGIRLSLAEMLISPNFLFRYQDHRAGSGASGPGAPECLLQGHAS